MMDGLKTGQWKTMQSKGRGTRRKGSAMMLLILALTLMVGTYATTVVKRAHDERRSEHHRSNVRLLETAIDSVLEFDFSDEKTIKLPLDEASAKWVIVEFAKQGDDAPSLTATLYRNDQPGLSIRRTQRSES